MAPRSLIVAALLAPAACSSKSQPTVQQPAPPPAATVNLASLTPDQSLRGFHVVARYLDATDQPMGARFVHDATGFVFDYVRIESAPQGFIYVNSFPTSDRGEPHTQEHLILGKGARGRRFGNVEAMSLAESSAFTMQWRTCYHFHTVAGHEVYWSVFENQLDALLNPDYTDEEIRREVRNFGVAKEADGSLRLEEKGTVYNEMVRSYESAERLVWRAADHLIYGAEHPLALSSGGWPEAIRAMTPDDIRGFHRATHYLGNMGMVGAFPSSMELGEVLDRTGAILDRLAGRTGSAMRYEDLPAPVTSPATTAVVEYPYADAAQPSPVMLVWPATRKLDLVDRTLLELFLGAVAGDESTNLYKKIVDSKARVLDVGATAVWGYVSSDQGQPVYIGLEGVAARALNPQGLEDIRKAVQAELARIAALPAGDPELVALGERVASRLADRRRRLAKFLNSPPGFGFRSSGGGMWMTHLLDLEMVEGFDRSLTMAPQLAAIEKILAAGGNPWTERLEAWGLQGAPHALAGKPSPALRQTLDRDRQARIDAELERLARAYGTKDRAETLKRFQAEYDEATAVLEAAAKNDEMPPFIDTPPMTLDDELKYETTKIAGVPIVASRIDSMTSSTVALAFRLDSVAEDRLPYLAVLPTLLEESGLFEDGKAIPSEQVKEALRREILSLSFHYATNARTGRAELVVTGAGNDLEETRRALGWMARLSGHPDWRTDNLPRLRDVIEQTLTSYRRITQGAEESWVNDPPTIWWRQRWPLFAHTDSFLTQIHDLHRLRWRLADPGDANVTAEVARVLRGLAAAKLDRKQLEALTQALESPPKKPDRKLAAYLRGVAKLSAPAKALVAMAGKDLRANLADVPDDALAADWAYLCKQMAADLAYGADRTLAELDGVRREVFDAGNARGWMVGSTASGEALRGDLEALLAGLPKAKLQRRTYTDRAFIVERLRGRSPAAKAPLFVGLVNPNTSGGVFVHSAPGATYADRDDDVLLDYLASNLYTGHGGHSIFMKTWAAGLAYSNGLRIALAEGRVRYYAERTPELPQTLRFVVDELRRAEPDPALAEYAIAEAFSSRVAASYEARARGIADDLTDGVTPEVVRGFRERLLALRKRDDLAADLFRRMEAVYGKVLPGYGPASATVPDAVYFVIGPAAQLDAWARYLETAEGKDATLHRLYPRDFWVTADVR